MGHKLGGTLKVAVVDPVEVLADETKEIINLAGFSATSLIKIVGMGITQHPDTTYTYNTDGVLTQVPIPLGTFFDPIFTCRDLGSFIEVENDFSVTVRNNSTTGRLYAAIVWYIRGRS